MTEPRQFSDARDLGAAFDAQLACDPADGALAWLADILPVQTPAVRSASAHLLGYTGNPDAIAWLDAHVASPVTGQWGVAAALLGTPWPRIADWLRRGGPHRLMALDTLLAYRKPAPNMAPLEQLAAPVLPQAPGRLELDAALAACLAAPGTPRVQAAAESITCLADEILRDGPRGVPVAHLPRLFLDPRPFDGAAVLDRHQAIVDEHRAQLDQLLRDKT